jgi:hypothetical protein
MTDDSRRSEYQSDDTDQRFERTVRNLLRTPPEPHATKPPDADRKRTETKRHGTKRDS